MTEEAFGQTIPEIPPNVQDYLVIQDVVAYGVTKRIALATQYVTDRPYASESYQVVNYGPGGQYGPHADGIGYYLHPGQTSMVADSAMQYYAHTGDRYATFMVYLSSVESGGGTTLPFLGLNINAISGDAVFWNNAWSEGRMDYLSVHGGCPVLVGSKWITNKWIQYHDQFRQSPCDLEEYRRVMTYTKWRETNLSH